MYTFNRFECCFLPESPRRTDRFRSFALIFGEVFFTRAFRLSSIDSAALLTSYRSRERTINKILFRGHAAGWLPQGRYRYNSLGGKSKPVFETSFRCSMLDDREESCDLKREIEIIILSAFSHNPVVANEAPYAGPCFTLGLRRITANG